MLPSSLTTLTASPSSAGRTSPSESAFFLPLPFVAPSLDVFAFALDLAGPPSPSSPTIFFGLPRFLEAAEASAFAPSSEARAASSCSEAVLRASAALATNVLKGGRAGRAAAADDRGRDAACRRSDGATSDHIGSFDASESPRRSTGSACAPEWDEVLSLEVWKQARFRVDRLADSRTWSSVLGPPQRTQSM